ncbi:MAG TPA: hypothetical protein VGR37_21515, partial [Longimicrobiaceae bacterium]|nr:hypothetical protein [Longimicrobiaceae bacterium]
MNRNSIFALAALAATAGACSPTIRPLYPVFENGAILASTSDEVVDAARAEGAAERERIAEQRERAEAAAFATCS